MYTTLHSKVKGLINKLKLFLDTAILEIETSPMLQAFMYWCFFSFVVSFASWIGSGYTGKYSNLPCWPHFQNCKDILPLTPFPYGYSENVLYTLLLAIITYGLYSLYKKEYRQAYYSIAILWLWKLFVISVTYGIGNYDYYDLIIITTFLFISSKRHHLRLVFIILYFLASTIKIGDGWILGTYFTSLQSGLPFIPDSLIPLSVNVVTIFQMVGSWFLLSKNEKVFNFARLFFIFFHLYSTTLVGFRYPVTSLFLTIILFGIEKEGRTTFQDLKLSYKHLGFYVFILLLFVLQLTGPMIAGNQKITLEGNNYGLYMFEANHQCISSYTLYTKDKTKKEYQFANAVARNRCDPYILMKRLQRRCLSDVTKISWTLDSSIDGGPLYRIVDTPDVCKLSFKAFTHNEWINITNPPYIAQVHKNIYDSGILLQSDENFIEKKDNITYMGNKDIQKNPPITKTTLQHYLEKNLNNLIFFYWALWVATLCVVIFNLFKNK